MKTDTYEMQALAAAAGTGAAASRGWRARWSSLGIGTRMTVFVGGLMACFAVMVFTSDWMRQRNDDEGSARAVRLIVQTRGTMVWPAEDADSHG